MPVQRRDQQLRLPLRESEKAAIEAAADRAGEPVTVWIRSVLIQAAEDAS